MTGGKDENMFWYFEVTVKNIKTGQEETFDASINNGFGSVNYFDAYKKVIDSAKSYIDGLEDNLHGLSQASKTLHATKKGARKCV